MCRGPWGHKESDMTERPKNSNNTCIWVSRGVLVVKTISNAGGMRCGSIPGWESSPGGRHSNPLQCSRLENLMDRGAWLSTVHGLTESDTAKEVAHTHTT